MKINKTDMAIALVDQGMTRYAAAKKVNLTASVLYIALKKLKPTVICPCCGGKVDAGRVLKQD